MIRNEIATTIDKPLEQVFDYLVDLEHLTEIDSSVVSVSRDSDGPIGEGTTWSHQRAFGPSKVNAPMRMLKFDRPRQFEYEVSTGGFKVVSTLTFEAESDGVTRVQETLEMNMQGFMRMLEPAIKSQIPKQVADVHQRMKEVIEALPE